MVNVECRECRKLYCHLIELIEHFRERHPNDFKQLVNYIKECEY